MPVMERQGSTLTAINTFGANGLISRWTSSGSTFYQFDERGDTAQRLNGSGTVLDYHGSDTYGLQYSSGGSGDPYLGFGAQWGYYRDSETSMYLLGHRYYDLNHCRFLNQDPIGFAGGINVYAYVGDDPATRIDPVGLNGADAELARSEWRARHCKKIQPLPGWLRFDAPADPFTMWPLAAGASGPGLYGLTGFTRHGLNRLLSKDDVGVSNQAFLDTLKNGVRTLEGDKIEIEGGEAHITLNLQGKVITTWPTSSSAFRSTPEPAVSEPAVSPEAAQMELQAQVEAEGSMDAAQEMTVEQVEEEFLGG